MRTLLQQEIIALEAVRELVGGRARREAIQGCYGVSCWLCNPKFSRKTHTIVFIIISLVLVKQRGLGICDQRSVSYIYAKQLFDWSAALRIPIGS